MYEVPIPNCTGHWVDDLDQMPTLLSGLYCINNDLKINAGDVISSTGWCYDLCSHMEKLPSMALLDVRLAAPPTRLTPRSRHPGCLLYLPSSNPQHVKLMVPKILYFTGLILAPRSTITLNGTGGNSYVGQVVGWNVEVGGTSDFYLVV